MENKELAMYIYNSMADMDSHDYDETKEKTIELIMAELDKMEKSGCDCILQFFDHLADSQLEEKCYCVSFKYSDSVYCANYVRTKHPENIDSEYQKYGWYTYREICESELESQARRGAPVYNL